MNERGLLGVTLYRTPAPQRLRAAAAAVHPYDRRLSDVWLWYAEQIERHDYYKPANRQEGTQTHATH